jgi:hypothetical protein
MTTLRTAPAAENSCIRSALMLAMLSFPFAHEMSRPRPPRIRALVIFPVCHAAGSAGKRLMVSASASVAVSGAWNIAFYGPVSLDLQIIRIRTRRAAG